MYKTGRVGSAVCLPFLGMENQIMKNIIAIILMLLMLLLQECGISLPTGEHGHPVQAVEDEIVNEGADSTGIPAPEAPNTPSSAPTASPDPTATAEPQHDYDGSLFGEPDTDF